MNQAEQITKRSKSNLAFAFFALPKERRADITTFYAFCREVDDYADDPGIPLDERRNWLNGWRTWLGQPTEGESSFAGEVRRIIEKYQIDRKLFEDILDGVESDLAPARFQTFEELTKYCYRVASAVGLVSIEIFGYRNAASRQYAYHLGIALQLTNIIRDVEVDLKNGGRIYLPLEELEEFSYSEDALIQRTYDQRFLDLMRFQAERARHFYTNAKILLPEEDVSSMVAAELMRGIYSTLLKKIESDQFRMFTRRYRLTRMEKILITLREVTSNRLGLNGR